MVATNAVQLREVIDKYGPYATILAIVLMVFVYLVHRNNKMYENIQNQFIEMTTKMVDQILEGADNANINNNTNNTPAVASEPDLMNTFVKLRRSMYEYCRDAMLTVHADRLAIYLFHNGAHSTHGVKFFKVSCICENVKIGSGIRERSMEQSNIPLNLFDEMIHALLDTGEFLILNNEELNKHNYRIFISSDKIKYAHCKAILDVNNTILGFILVESTSEYDNNTIKEQNIEIDKLINQISPVLTYVDYIKTNIERTSTNVCGMNNDKQ